MRRLCRYPRTGKEVAAIEVSNRASLKGITEAAQELGVHQNTLRRWADKGLVRVVKLPSGQRRFRPEEVERLRRQMYDDLAEAVVEQQSAHQTKDGLPR